MANHVDTYITVYNLDDKVKDKLNEIFKSYDEDNYLAGVELINRLWGTTFTWNQNLTHEENEAEGNTLPDREWMDENIGSKWIGVDVFDMNENDANISVSTAWDYPEGFVRKLTDVLTEVKKDVYIAGLFEDESIQPVGAFVFAHEFDDVEEMEHEYDVSEVWENDDIRDEFYDELHNLRDGMIADYLDFLNDEE
jgi:hypothetical protein